MSKTLVGLIILGVFLLWKFVLFPEKLDFTDRVKVLQGLNFAAPYKMAIAEYGQKNGQFPGAAQWQELKEAVSVDLEGSIIGNIAVAASGPGTITIYYSNARDHSIDP